MFTSSSHLHHIFITSSSHLHHIFITSSSHLHHIFITSSSHLHHIFITSSHVHIFITSSHVHIFITSSHVHIFITSSSHLHHIFTSSHLLIFTSLHLHIFSLSLSHSLSLSPSLSLAGPLSLFLSFSLSLSLSLAAGGAEVATLSREMRFECQKLRSNWDFTSSAATLSHEKMLLKDSCGHCIPTLTRSSALTSHPCRKAKALACFFAHAEGHPRHDSSCCNCHAISSQKNGRPIERHTVLVYFILLCITPDPLPLVL